MIEMHHAERSPRFQSRSHFLVGLGRIVGAQNPFSCFSWMAYGFRPWPMTNRP
jgi:hypothetical protein